MKFRKLFFTLCHLAFGFLLFVNVSTSESSTIAIVKTKETGIYNLPIESFKNTCQGDVIVYNMNGDKAEGHKIAQKLNNSKPDVVVALGTFAAKIIKSELVDIPIVYSLVVSPEKHGLQGENITGIMLKVPVKTQFEKLKKIDPKIKRIGVVHNTKFTSMIDEAKSVAQSIGITIVAKEIASASEVPKALASIRGKIDALYFPPDRTLAGENTVKFMVMFSIQNKLSLLVPSGKFVKKGGLIALNPDFKAIGTQTANIVNLILNGTPPSKIPPEPPAEVQIIINKNTLKQIGVKIPKSLTAKIQKM